MNKRAPKVGDYLFLIGNKLRVVGLGSETLVAAYSDNSTVTLSRRNQGITWELSNAQSSAQLGAKKMQETQKSAFNVLVLQHLPVPGIPETTAAIKTTLVGEPQIVLATNADAARAIALRGVPTTVDVEYIEVLVREF